MFLGAVWLVTAAVVGFMLGRISMYNMYGVWGMKEEPAEGVGETGDGPGKPAGILAFSQKGRDSKNLSGGKENLQDNEKFSGTISVQDILDPIGASTACEGVFAVKLQETSQEGDLWGAADEAAQSAYYEEGSQEGDLWEAAAEAAQSAYYEEGAQEGDLWGAADEAAQSAYYEEEAQEGDLWGAADEAAQSAYYEEGAQEGEFWEAADEAVQSAYYEEGAREGDLWGAADSTFRTKGSTVGALTAEKEGTRNNSISEMLDSFEAAASAASRGRTKTSVSQAPHRQEAPGSHEGRTPASASLDTPWQTAPARADAKGEPAIDILNFGRPGEAGAFRSPGQHHADRKTWIAGQLWETERRRAGRVMGLKREEARRLRTEHQSSGTGARGNGKRRGRRFEDDQKVWSVGSPVSGEIVADREGEYAAVVICPDEDCLYAPTGGKITRLFPMGNAFLFTTDFGAELYIQAGDIEDEMLVRYYRPRIIQNEVVTKGKLLLEFDRKGLEEAGASYDVSVCVENGFYGGNVKMTDAEWVETGEEILQMREAALQTESR